LQEIAVAKQTPIPGVDPKRVQARKDGREAAHMVVNQLSWIRGYGADFADALCEELRKKLPQHKTAEPPAKPVPFARVAATHLLVGKHAGWPLEKVPIDYLEWLIDQKRRELKQITDYLEHPERPEE
jgi:hypothetical protein